MKANMIRCITILFFVFIFAVPFLSAKNTPCLNKGKKWRIGYYEGGPYSDYTDTMRTLVTGLIERGWITDKPPPDYHEEMPKPYLDWLIKSNSPYLTFSPENGYSANWDEELRNQMRREILQKLKQGELDLIIAMGTWAGQDIE